MRLHFSDKSYLDMKDSVPEEEEVTNDKAGVAVQSKVAEEIGRALIVAANNNRRLIVAY